jgi:hypothetical protein
MRCPTCHRLLPEGTTECPDCARVDTEPTVVYTRDADHLDADRAGHMRGVHGWALVVERGPRTGMTFVLTEGITTIGRHPESDIFLDDVTVSRHHCRITVADGSVILEDSGSTNGTYVDGTRVDRAPLHPGARVLVGKFHLVVAAGDD